MTTPIRRFAITLISALCLLPAARAQHPLAHSDSPDKPWPRVGFVEVLDGRKYVSDMGHTNGEAGDFFIDMRGAGDGSGRIFLATRHGLIYIMKDGKVLPEPFLDISKLTTFEGERGLLSIAFPPDFKTKGHFYIYFTNLQHDVDIARYKVDPANPNKALPDSAENILVVNHRKNVNHNGGQLQFGHDGMLYFAIGDGGAGYDPDMNAQNLGTYLGKMMRLDVEGKPDEGKPYHIPTDNPFLKTPGALPEIWALGLRNPWRFSFDPTNGDLYIGNVGQNDWEQIYFAPGTSKGGENYGWSIYEGSHGVAEGSKPTPSIAQNAAQKPGTSNGITFPVAEYSHTIPPKFTSITGGYVYRGKEFPNWQGVYFFSDWGNGGNVGQIWAMRKNAAGGWETHQVDDNKSPVLKCVSLGRDDDGNIYSLSFGDGKIFKLVELPAGQ